MLLEQTESRMREFWSFLGQRNLDAAEDYIAADYKYHGPGGIEASGVGGFKEMLSVYFAAFSDLSFTVHEIICEGNRAVSRFIAKGTHDGDLMGLPPTGKEICFDGMVIARIVDGKIVEEWEVLDELSMMQKLGALPAE